MTDVSTMFISVIVFITSLFFIRFYLKSIIKKCECKTSLIGKTVIVTGANSGIGFHTANKLAKKGAKVILACRNENRGRSAEEKIRNATSNTRVFFRQLDLASFKSIKDFANSFLETENRLDVLVNNAGACALSNVYTTDGIIEGMQVNHLGPFLLTLLLLPLLKKSKPSRIVNVSSKIYFFGIVNLKKINETRMNRTILYADSKLCNLLIHQELARRLSEMGVTVNSVHPGVIFTNILFDPNPIFGIFFKFLCWINCRTPENGAETVVHLAVAEEFENVTGKFYVDCEDRYLFPKGRDPVFGKELWTVSENIIKNYL